MSPAVFRYLLLASYLVSHLAAAPLMRRLTHSQYNRTVRDLMGDSTEPARQFPTEDFVNGFKNQGDVQNVPPLLAEAYGAAAEKLARDAFRGGDARHLIPCDVRNRECRGQFVREFGLRAFRRPLGDQETTRYVRLFEREKDVVFIQGAQLVVEAMLQSTNFLFRVEAGRPETKPYEAASRLSYFLWDSMPDEALFRAAASGDLSSPEGIERAARRMIEDPLARQALDEFVAQWLRFDRVLNTVKDRARYPMFNPELAAAMTQETRLLVADAVWTDRNFMTIFSADYGFLSADLASLYKFPAPATEFQRIQFPSPAQRAGLTGQATFLTLTSKPDDTSPTSRGLFVREQFLCQRVPDPPPGANASLPPLTEDKPQTNRERLGVHLSNPSCASCHQLIDPIGFGLEHYDAVGQYRDKFKLTFAPGRKDKDKETKTVELAMDASGAIAGITNSDFSSPRELGRLLAASSECQECIVKQLFRYGFGRRESSADRPMIQSASRKFRESGFRFKELMVALAAAYADGA